MRGDLSRDIFRQMPEIRLVRRDGSLAKGRGTVTRLKKEASRLAAGNRHGAGELGSSLYAFTGWLDEAEPGETLEHNGKAYTVLWAEAEECAGAQICVRALLERRVSEDDGA